MWGHHVKEQVLPGAASPAYPKVTAGPSAARRTTAGGQQPRRRGVADRYPLLPDDGCRYRTGDSTRIRCARMPAGEGFRVKSFLTVLSRNSGEGEGVRSWGKAA